MHYSFYYSISYAWTQAVDNLFWFQCLLDLSILLHESMDCLFLSLNRILLKKVFIYSQHDGVNLFTTLEEWLRYYSKVVSCRLKSLWVQFHLLRCVIGMVLLGSITHLFYLLFYVVNVIIYHIPPCHVCTFQESIFLATQDNVSFPRVLSNLVSIDGFSLWL